jgi:hypothetical protein
MALGKLLSCEALSAVFADSGSDCCVAGALGLLQAVAINMNRTLKMSDFFMSFFPAGS